ncbi:nitrate- and nitrite sensing domain-containing protein [Kitasatospora arboriphila]
MRLRSSSIRAKIIALLMVPIVALTGLWVYATLVTTGDVRSQFDVSSSFHELVKPVDQYTLDLQEERRAAVLRLADPGSQANKDAYEHAQAATDHSLRELRYLNDTEALGQLDAQQRTKYQDILTAADQLSAIRGQALRDVVSWDHELLAYSDLVETVFPFRSAFAVRQSGQLPRQTMLLTELVRAREYLSCEAAAMQALRVTDKPGDEMIQVALDNMHSQQALFSVYAASSTSPTSATTPTCAAPTTGWRSPPPRPTSTPRCSAPPPSTPTPRTRGASPRPRCSPPTPTSTPGSPTGSGSAPSPTRSTRSSAAPSPV